MWDALLLEGHLMITGKSDDDFKAVIQRIEENIMELKKRLSESGVLRE